MRKNNLTTDIPVYHYPAMTPIGLLIQSIIRFLLAAAFAPLIKKGIVSVQIASGAEEQLQAILWFAGAGLLAYGTLLWSHYRNKVALRLQQRIDAYLGGKTPIPSVAPTEPATQSTVTPVPLSTEPPVIENPTPNPSTK